MSITTSLDLRFYYVLEWHRFVTLLGTFLGVEGTIEIPWKISFDSSEFRYKR